MKQKFMISGQGLRTLSQTDDYLKQTCHTQEKLN